MFLDVPYAVKLAPASVISGRRGCWHGRDAGGTALDRENLVAQGTAIKKDADLPPVAEADEAGVGRVMPAWAIGRWGGGGHCGSAMAWVIRVVMSASVMSSVVRQKVLSFDHSCV